MTETIASMKSPPLQINAGEAMVLPHPAALPFPDAAERRFRAGGPIPNPPELDAALTWHGGMIRVPELRIADLHIAGRRIRVRATNFGKGQTFETLQFCPDGFTKRLGVPCPLLIRPSQAAVDQALQRLERFREEWITEYVRQHDDAEVCYWFNWLCQVEESPVGRHPGGYRYRIHERGCPALYDPVIDKEYERGGEHDQAMSRKLAEFRERGKQNGFETVPAAETPGQE